MKKILLLIFTINVNAQPPPPPPATPLIPPVDPVGNVSTADKILLGKALYWDEQLSSTKTVACASCHIMSSGGTDPRSDINNSEAINPGFDGTFNTADDIMGSPGVVENCDQGDYTLNNTYGYKPQVTGKKSPSVINSGYAPNLFWDGRAGQELIDPVTNVLVLSSGAALEAQVLGPPTSDVEMSHTGRSWIDIIDVLESSSPMALSPNMSVELSDWINSQSYYELFNQAFGSSEITAAKAAMAIASYERSLYSNQSPFDENLAGNPGAMTQQQRRGLGVFRNKLCGGCHVGALLSDNNFHNIGVTPNIEDEGRFAVTGVNADRGRFKTPPLRNLGTRSSFMHTGSFVTLEAVINFYDRGGDFSNPNLDPRMVPLNMTQTEKNDLLVFLRDALTDDRVSNETGPFTSPTLYSESTRVPIITGIGVAGLDSKLPILTAIEPPLIGNSSFTVAIENAKENSASVFVIDEQDPGTLALPNQQDSLIYMTKTLLSTNGDGHASISVALPNDSSYIGSTLYGRWFIEDDQAVNGYAISPLLELTLFAPSVGQAGKMFSGGFETISSSCNNQ